MGRGRGDGLAGGAPRRGDFTRKQDLEFGHNTHIDGNRCARVGRDTHVSNVGCRHAGAAGRLEGDTEVLDSSAQGRVRSQDRIGIARRQIKQAGAVLKLGEKILQRKGTQVRHASHNSARAEVADAGENSAIHPVTGAR